MNRRISCVNQATVDLGVDFNTLIGTLNKFVNGPFAEVWGASADLDVALEIKPGEWGMVFLDDADQAARRKRPNEEDRRGHRSELRKFGEHGNNNRK